MLKKTMAIYEEMDTMMEMVMRKASLDAFVNMDADEIALVQSWLKMYNIAKDLAFEQAKIIEEQSNKLDMILLTLQRMEMKSL